MEAREFSRFLIYWMHKKGLRKAKVAEAAGLSRSHFSKILLDGNRIEGVGIGKCHKLLEVIGATWIDYQIYLYKYVGGW